MPFSRSSFTPGQGYTPSKTEADLGPPQKRVCQAPSSVNPFLPCRAALFGKQPLTSKGCGVGLSAFCCSGTPETEAGGPSGKPRAPAGAGERAARSLGRPVIDLPDASSPAFIRSSVAVCLVAVFLGLRSARYASPPPRRESSRPLSAGKAAGRGSGNREGRSGWGSRTRALRLRRHGFSPPAATCALRRFSFHTDVFLPRRRCRLHADTSPGPRWEGSPLTPASIYPQRGRLASVLSPSK